MTPNQNREPTDDLLQFGPLSRNACCFLLMAIMGTDPLDIQMRREYSIEVGLLAQFSETKPSILKLRLWDIARELMACPVRLSARAVPRPLSSRQINSLLFTNFFSCIMIGQADLETGQCRSVMVIFNPNLVNVLARVRFKLEQMLQDGMGMVPDEDVSSTLDEEDNEDGGSPA